MIVQSSHFKKQFDVSKAQLIGEGNFAQVYKIFDSETQTPLAIRRVDRDLGEGQDIEKERTINEQLRKVENEHILKIFDIIQSQKCVWYITEYCEGGSLWDALNNCNDNKMNERDALQVIHQVSKGVKELHNHRITHRDLKPQNILLGSKYIPNKPIPIIKLADFGLSTKKIIMETIAGTKEYIAPEQARFHNYTNAVDVWSLGIIFDEILHGSPFYVGDNNKEVFQKILKNPYKVRDQTIRPSIQEFLISVLKKKAYERPIIAVICQNIQKIIEQIKRERGQTEQNSEKIISFEKKAMKSLINIPTQIKSPMLLTSQVTELKQGNQSLGDIIAAQQSESKNIRTNVGGRSIEQKQKSQNKVEQKRSKTPFKRQNGRPQLIRPPTQQTNSQLSTSLPSLQKFRDPISPVTPLTRKQLQNSIVKNMQRSKQKPMPETNENVKTQVTLQSDKINIYRVEKKKIQSLVSKTSQQVPNIVDIKDYMDGILKMKADLQQSCIGVAKEREFIPNAQLTINEFPEKFEGEQILRKYKKNYDYLNYIAYKPDYQIKLYTSKSTLNEQSSRTQKQLLQHKQKIKKSFLGQIDKFVDYYIQKTLK